MPRRAASADPGSIRVVVVAARVAAARAIAAQLRAAFPDVEPASAGALRKEAAPGVYVVVVDPALPLARAAALGARALARRDVGLVGLCRRGGIRAREALLAAGYDEAITGAPETRELVVRIAAVHRRVHWGEGDGRRLGFGPFALDLAAGVLATDGVRLALAPAELAVMRELIRARGRLLSRGELLEAAWDRAAGAIDPRAVDNVILRLRRKLPRAGAIETVRGVGFRLAAGRRG